MDPIETADALFIELSFPLYRFNVCDTLLSFNLSILSRDNVRNNDEFTSLSEFSAKKIDINTR